MNSSPRYQKLRLPSHSAFKNSPTNKRAQKICSGKVVTVIMLGRQGPFVEGRGIIVNACNGRLHYYRVRFIGERVTKIRFVHPEWQTDPKTSFELLLEFWRTSARTPDISDFFPNDHD